MTNVVRQYRPTSFVGFVNAVFEFETLNQLLAIDFVKHFANLPTFHRFSLDENRLMAEYKDGEVFWVVAMIDQPEAVDLPTWTPPEDSIDS